MNVGFATTMVGYVDRTEELVASMCRLNLLIPAYCPNCARIVQPTPNGDNGVRCQRCANDLPLRSDHDVFISYGTANIDAATALARKLHADGISFWLAPDQLDPGESFLEEIADAIPRTRIMIFLLSEQSMASPWVVREAAMGISCKITVFAIRLGELKLTGKWQFMLTDIQWATADSKLSDVDLSRLASLISKRLVPATAEALLQKRPPERPREVCGVDPKSIVYVGPRPFPEGMETRFFGREVEMRTLIELLSKSSVLLMSPSGAGKSSLLSAGLTPALRGAGHQVLSRVRLGRSLPVEIEHQQQQIQNIFAFSVVHELEGVAAAAQFDTTVAQALASLPDAEPGKLRVLILDQFEELFTLHIARWADRLPFMEQLVEALQQDPNLRILFAMRQEYLADFQVLIEDVPAECKPATLHLRRMERNALNEVIRRPAERFAEFADDTVDAIVDQLKMVRVQQPDGSFVEMRGEFVELVHLQIVCSRLWNSLPEGLKRVETEHLARAAEDVSGQDFGGFVKNALDVFYNDVITRVSNSAETARNGGFSAELLKLGCMKFVSRDGTRQPIQEGKTRTGRLPNWIVKQLADLYLLRTESVGSDRWFELSHDLIACAVVRDLSPRVSELLFASDRLEKELRRVADAHGDALTGLFDDRTELLEACKPFQQSAGLYDNEAEFLFRICIGSGHELAEWSTRIRTDHPSVHRRVILDALASKNPLVRANAIRLLTINDDPELRSALVQVGISDPDNTVRRVAANALLQLDDLSLFGEVLDKLDSPAESKQASRLASLMLALSDVRAASRFDRSYRGLSASQRRRIRVQAWRTRLVDAMPILPYTLLPTGVFAALAAGLYKWIPGSFNLALVQEEAGAGMGFFHGVTAGFFWGGIIPAALAVHRLVFWNARSHASIFRPVGNIAFGILGAIISSAIVVGIILSVYSLQSLNNMCWITKSVTQRNSMQFLEDAFVVTRMGWAHIILGVCMGIGMAMTTNYLRATGKWEAYLGKVSAPSTLRGMGRLIAQITRVVLRHAWPIPVMLAIGGVAVWGVADAEAALNDPPNQKQLTKQHVIPGIIGDASCQLVGSIGAIVGLGVGIVILRRGLNIAPKTDVT